MLLILSPNKVLVMADTAERRTINVKRAISALEGRLKGAKKASFCKPGRQGLPPLEWSIAAAHSREVSLTSPVHLMLYTAVSCWLGVQMVGVSAIRV